MDICTKKGFQVFYLFIFDQLLFSASRLLLLYKYFVFLYETSSQSLMVFCIAIMHT